MVKVTIRRDECISCGVCATNCSDVFELDEQDIAHIVTEYRTKGPGEGEIPEDLENCATVAARDCPVSIIEVT